VQRAVYFILGHSLHTPTLSVNALGCQLAVGWELVACIVLQYSADSIHVTLLSLWSTLSAVETRTADTPGADVGSVALGPITTLELIGAVLKDVLTAA
jgi:hypothetical protein